MVDKLGGKISRINWVTKGFQKWLEKLSRKLSGKIWLKIWLKILMKEFGGK